MQTPRRPARWCPLLFTLFTLFLCLPILQVTYPPLVDYPNHLARTAILARYQQVESFRAAYTILYEPIANLAMDLVVPPLSRFGSIFAAGKLFLVLIVLVYASGCYLLASGIQGKGPWMAFVPLPWIYNSNLLMGFVNYLAGIALFLVAFALWLRWKAAWTPLRALAFALLAIVCYFAHLSSIAILALSVMTAAAWECFAGRLSFRNVGVAGAAFIPAGVLYLVFMAGSGRLGTLEWNSLSGKFILLFTVVRSYDIATDVILLLGLLGCLLCLAPWKAGRALIDTPVMIAGAALALAFVASPKVVFTSSAADARFLWPACVLLALSCRPRVSVRKGALCLSAFLLIYSVRTGIIASHWRQLDAKAARVVRLFESLPEQVKIYPAFFPSDSDVESAKLDHALEHVVCYAVVFRNAYVPTVFAQRGQQPLVDTTRPAFRVWTPGRGDPMRGYEYVWTYNPPRELTAQLEHGATLIARSDESSLWRTASNAPGGR